MRILTNSAFLFIFILLSGCVTGNVITKEKSANLYDSVCKKGIGGASPWNLKQLFDCNTQSYFIPYQIWTGGEWNGDKNAACMHKADLYFTVNNNSTTTIKGPHDWVNPNTGEHVQVWERSKTNGSKTQRFACHAKGIGRVYDSRGPRYYDVGRCKFPAGYGWKIGERRSCRGTSIEITSITVDENNNLENLTFKWWSGSYLDHIYVYAPNQGMLTAWKQ